MANYKRSSWPIFREWVGSFVRGYLLLTVLGWPLLGSRSFGHVPQASTSSMTAPAYSLDILEEKEGKCTHIKPLLTSYWQKSWHTELKTEGSLCPHHLAISFFMNRRPAGSMRYPERQRVECAAREQVDSYPMSHSVPSLRPKLKKASWMDHPLCRYWHHIVKGNML